VINVIMSVYNAEQTLRDSIDSLLEQTIPPSRIIIVDDASTDTTASILEAYSSSQIHVITNDVNQHVARSLNRAMEYLSDDCQYVARMDADDICLPHRFSCQIDYFENNRCVDIIGSDVLEFSSKGTSIKKFPRTTEEMKAALLFRCPFCHSSMMFRRRVFLLNRYDSALLGCEDHGLWAALLWDQGLFAQNLAEPLLKYRRHASQVTASSVGAPIKEILYNSMLERLGIVIPEDLRVPLFQFFSGDFSALYRRTDRGLICAVTFLVTAAKQQGRVTDRLFVDELLVKWLKYCRSLKSRRGMVEYLRLVLLLDVGSLRTASVKQLFHDLGGPFRGLNGKVWTMGCGLLVCPILTSKAIVRLDWK